MTAREIKFDATDDLFRSDHIHATRERANHVAAEGVGLVLFIPVTERNGPRAPATTAGATRQSANGVDELMRGIGFPLRRFAPAGDDHARSRPFRFSFAFDRGAEMHQKGYGTENPFGVVNQVDEIPDVGFAA